jgi:hypothetical protein
LFPRIAQPIDSRVYFVGSGLPLTRMLLLGTPFERVAGALVADFSPSRHGLARYE